MFLTVHDPPGGDGPGTGDRLPDTCHAPDLGSTSHPLSLTPTRVANLPVSASQMCSRPMGFRSAWMAKAAGWTMYLLSASGAV